uniref:Uncharacterized protein n=1 Tax=uncultured marine thaumarchaeote KM3_67_E09 TaxID=1456238 RepID=A0A075HHH1_9ARCH|nr:hypothetical protein [uncultured marine thaumarchaeote KM3_67_E09]
MYSFTCSFDPASSFAEQNCDNSSPLYPSSRPRASRSKASNSSAVISSKSLESPNHCPGFIAIVTPELNIIPATTAKKIIPFFLVFTVKILNYHVISDCHQYENIIKVLNRQ